MKKHPDSHHATASGLNAALRLAAQIIGGKDKGSSLKGRGSRTKARKESNRMTTEEVAANAISTGNVATFDPLLATRPIDPRLQRMLDSLDGAETPAKKAVKERVIMAWNRLHGARAMATDQGTSGDA